MCLLHFNNVPPVYTPSPATSSTTSSGKSSYLLHGQSSEGELQITSEKGTSAFTIERFHVCGNVVFEKRWACVFKKGEMGRGGLCDKRQKHSVSAYRLVWREKCDLSEQEGWLSDFTSPFQLQQLPIYIVMQIHGLSQMVLFQHRGCIEIWIFIPNTSQVFNAPSSVCVYPFFPLTTVYRAVWCRGEEKKKKK